MQQGQTEPDWPEFDYATIRSYYPGADGVPTLVYLLAHPIGHANLVDKFTMNRPALPMGLSLADAGSCPGPWPALGTIDLCESPNQYGPV